MHLIDWADAGSWTSKLYTILRPAPRPLMGKFGNSCSRFRHSPGDIWRHALADSVYHDLAGTALRHYSRSSVLWRRFVRVEHLGLSGVVFYEIPIPPCNARTARGGLNSRHASDHRITLKKVFGDLDDQADVGMDLDDLLDEIDAKVVYFPAYACTSFTVGQVMSAFLHDRPAHQPFPAHQGFSICLGKQNLAATPEPLPVTGCPTLPVDDFSTWSPCKAGAESASRHDALLLEPGDPYVALCVRSCTLYDLRERHNPPRLFFGDDSNQDDSVVAIDGQSSLRSKGFSTSKQNEEDSESIQATLGSDARCSHHVSTRVPSALAKKPQTLYMYNDLISFLDFTTADLKD